MTTSQTHEDPNACAGAILIGRMKRRIKLSLVSSGLGRADADRMGFAYFDSVEAAIAADFNELCLAGLGWSDCR